MLADFVQNKWILKLENSPCFTFFHYYCTIWALRKFEFNRVWCLALFYSNTALDLYSIYGTDTQCFKWNRIIWNIVSLYYAFWSLLFQNLLTHSLFAFKVSTYDFPIDWFRYFRTFCNRSWWILNSYTNIHVKFNISTFSSPKCLAHSEQNTYNLLKFVFK